MQRVDMDTAFRRVRDIRLALAALLVLSMTANLALTVGFRRARDRHRAGAGGCRIGLGGRRQRCRRGPGRRTLPGGHGAHGGGDRQRGGPMSGGVQASLLAAQRLVYRLHRAGIAWGTSGSAALCGRYPMPVMKKSQYRWQMTQPVPATTPRTGCNPTGRSSVLWETLRELPVSGESFGYLLWRKRSCCLL